jgi:hypothetical protein
MARQLRIQYEGAIYHLMSQGDRREEIFRVAINVTLPAELRHFCFSNQL